MMEEFELNYDLQEIWFTDDDWSWLQDYVDDGLDLWEGTLQ